MEVSTFNTAKDLHNKINELAQLVNDVQLISSIEEINLKGVEDFFIMDNMSERLQKNILKSIKNAIENEETELEAEFKKL